MTDYYDEIILETDFWIAVLGTKQVYLGRLIVNCKRPICHLSELKSEELLDLLTIFQKLEKSLSLAFGAKMFNWLCLNNGNWRNYPQKEVKKNLHWHLIPRYSQEFIFENQVFVDNSFGHKFDWESAFGNKLEKQSEHRDFLPPFRHAIINKIQENF